MRIKTVKRLHIFVFCIFIFFFLDLISKKYFLPDNPFLMLAFLSLPSFASVPLVAFFFWSIGMLDESKCLKKIFFIFVGCVSYEFMQALMPSRTFDFMDILAITLGYFSTGSVFRLKQGSGKFV